MKCPRCRYNNPSLIFICLRCGTPLAHVFWEGKRLRGMLGYALILFTFFAVIGFLLSPINLEGIFIGIVVGIIASRYAIRYFSKRIVNNRYIMSQPLSRKIIKRFYLLSPLIAILIVIIFSTFKPTFTLICYILWTSGWITAVTLFIWLIIYEKHHGYVYAAKE